MKKLVFLLAVAFSAALYSCGNKAEEATEAATDAVEVAEEQIVETVDTTAVDTIVAVTDSVVAAE